MTPPQRPPIVLTRGPHSHAWRAGGGALAPAAVPAALPQPAVSRTARALDRWSGRIRAVSAVFFVLALAVLALQASIRGFETRGASMEPAIHSGDRLIINHLAYAQVDFGLLDWAPFIDPGGHWASPGRGDIIVFHSPVEDADLVKRVIALPGDHVEITRGLVVVNTRDLTEPYTTGPTTCIDICAWDVPAGHYFVLGDNRGNSRDSREGWMVPRANVIGEKLLTY